MHVRACVRVHVRVMCRCQCRKDTIDWYYILNVKCPQCIRGGIEAVLESELPEVMCYFENKKTANSSLAHANSLFLEKFLVVFPPRIGGLCTPNLART